ncbi:MAG: tetratricopeptide repeat protein [Kiritimatiellaeota bacterium]|nr:tetratricopeptide repeat protein [Kiritimatiellota bacterium]
MIKRRYIPGWRLWACSALGLAGWARVAAVADSNGVDRAALLQAVRAALEDGFYQPARAAFEQVLAGATNAAERVADRIWLARALLGLQQYDAALRVLQDGAGPGAQQQAGLTYWTARVQFAQGQSAAALALAQDFDARYPGHALAGPALRLTALAALRLGQTERAVEAFQRFQKEYPQAPEAAENLLDWAGALVTGGQPEEARQRLEQLIREHPAAAVADSGRLQLDATPFDRKGGGFAGRAGRSVAGPGGAVRGADQPGGRRPGAGAVREPVARGPGQDRKRHPARQPADPHGQHRGRAGRAAPSHGGRVESRTGRPRPTGCGRHPPQPEASGPGAE